MKVLDRISLIDQIGRELQRRMSYGEIDTYLKAYGVDTKKITSSVNSKWVYTKDLLGDEKNSTILRIADELQVPHNYTIADSSTTLEATFWEPFHLKLFISHLSVIKETAGLLQSALRRFGISAFVAHVDIEPTKEWLSEIEAGLFTMDALVAILMPGYKESTWTDQEVGVAVGRGVLVIPVIRGLSPYGFISKYQGLSGTGKSVSGVAKEIFQILVTSPKTRARMLSCLTETTLQSPSAAEAAEKLEHLGSTANIPIAHLERLREGAPLSAPLISPLAAAKLNSLLAKYNLEPVPAKQELRRPKNDDIPF